MLSSNVIKLCNVIDFYFRNQRDNLWYINAIDMKKIQTLSEKDLKKSFQTKQNNL